MPGEGTNFRFATASARGCVPLFLAPSVTVRRRDADATGRGLDILVQAVLVGGDADATLVAWTFLSKHGASARTLYDAQTGATTFLSSQVLSALWRRQERRRTRACVAWTFLSKHASSAGTPTLHWCGFVGEDADATTPQVASYSGTPT